MPKKRQRKRKTITINGTFDIETQDWTKYTLGGVKTHDGVLLFDWRKESALFEYMLDFEGVLWGHNAGNYDTLWFTQWLQRYKEKAQVFSAGQRITLLKVRKLEIRDSFALIPLALKKAADIGGIPKLNTGLPCVCRGNPKNRSLIISNLRNANLDNATIQKIIATSGCGGYCSIRRGMSKRLMDRLRTYLTHDLQSLDSTLERVKDYALEHDIDLCGTIGASSWNTAARSMSLPSAHWGRKDGGGEKALYSFIKEGYKGGRTQMFMPNPPPDVIGWRVDIVSSYPAALKELRLPWGKRRELYDAQSNKAYYEGKEGIYEATVVVPPMHIPPLPVRCVDRIAYPIGRISGVWPANELRYAESIGCTITSFGKSVVWDDSHAVFESYCTRIWGLRDDADPKSSLGQFLKWFANSLTGKLAQDPLNEQCIIGLSPDDLFCTKNFVCDGTNCPAQGSGLCCPHSCDKSRHYSPLGRSRTIGVKEVWMMPDCAHIHWAAYLTAHARIKLHKCLIADGQGGRTAVYCDTDSVFSTTERTYLRGKDLGMFNLDGSGRWMLFNGKAPKTYSFVDPETGEFIARSKGFPDASKNYDKLSEGVLIDRGVKSFRMAAKGDDMFTRKSFTRKITGKCGKCTKANTVCPHRGDRILLPDGLTHPVDVQYLALHGTDKARPQPGLSTP